jgi:ABC-type glutathione transport system ATPase component
MTSLLRVEGLGKVFAVRSRWSAFVGGKSVVRAVDDLSLEIAESETLALVGESGCGKSTTGRLVMRLIEPSAGRIVFEGTDITASSGAALRRARRRMQMVFQDPRSSLSPRRTILQTVAEPLDANGLIRSPAHRRELVAQLLESVGLSPSVPASSWRMSRYRRSTFRFRRRSSISCRTCRRSGGSPTCSSRTISPSSDTSPTA